MSYDPNGRNSRQDILEEIERVLRDKETKKALEARKTNPRESERHCRHGKQDRPTGKDTL
jgi:hypothetical protein